MDGYLPIYQKLEMDEKIIAITVDDLGQPENLKQICQIAADSNAKLTLFPVGKMLENSEVRSTVKHAYEDLGFEIENHTYGHNKLYMLSDSEMAEAIFKQQQMVSSVLGVNYQMHFLRMPGGNGETDPRSHQYLDQRNGKRELQQRRRQHQHHEKAPASRHHLSVSHHKQGSSNVERIHSLRRKSGLSVSNPQ